MQEKSIVVAGEFGLEAGLALGRGSYGVVLAHPHPLYGGDMRNPVITAMMHVFQEYSWSTLRFNFRGVGASCGTYNEGHGERLMTCWPRQPVYVRMGLRGFFWRVTLLASG